MASKSSSKSSSKVGTYAKVAVGLEAVGAGLMIAGLFMPLYSEKGMGQLFFFGKKETAEGKMMNLVYGENEDEPDDTQLSSAIVISIQAMAVVAVVLCAGSVVGMKYKVLGMSLGAIGVLLGASAFIWYTMYVKKNNTAGEGMGGTILKDPSMASGSYLWLCGHLVVIGGLVSAGL